MRRYFMMIFILTLVFSCCGISFPLIHTPATVTSTPPSSTFTPLPPSPTSTLTSISTPSPVPATLTPSPTSTLTQSPAAFTVYYHPDDLLYVDDQVSFEVVSPPSLDMKDAKLEVQIDPPTGQHLNPGNFGAWGIAGRAEATLLWAWDTKGYTTGSHTLAYDVEPQGYRWTDEVTLLPADAMPSNQANAHWAETTTQCCTVFYITETAAQRDLSDLSSLVDAQAQDAIAKMGADFTEPITITVLPRLLGHGGFTSTEISVSYLDRNYASNDWALVVHHEMIHAIDGRLGGEFRPTIFVEGLAVYMTGGHYKPEPFMPRAAALLDNYLNLYLPLKPLADDFYASQHEIGYLEGASLIEYMIKTYGEPAFFSFYRDIHNKSGESQSDSINAALEAHFSISFSQLEINFITALKSELDTAAWMDDVRLMVKYYDTMRRYQQLLDPSAYFRTAWLLDNKSMRERGIVADYLRHPQALVNLALETLLITAGQQLSARDYSSADQVLTQISSVLDGIEHGTSNPFAISTLTSDYLSIISSLEQQGYEPQNITVTGDTAAAHVTNSVEPAMIQLNLRRVGGRWSINP